MIPESTFEDAEKIIRRASHRTVPSGLLLSLTLEFAAAFGKKNGRGSLNGAGGQSRDEQEPGTRNRWSYKEERRNKWDGKEEAKK